MSSQSGKKAPLLVDYIPTAGLDKRWRERRLSQQRIRPREPTTAADGFPTGGVEQVGPGRRSESLRRTLSRSGEGADSAEQVRALFHISQEQELRPPTDEHLPVHSARHWAGDVFPTGGPPATPVVASSSTHHQRFVSRTWVASGGMGEVWKAWDQRHQRWVALKFLHSDLAHHPEARARFLREKEHLQALSHPCIVSFYEVDSAEQCLVMEWIEGPTLRNVLQSQGRLPLGLVLRVLLQVGSALEHAHEHQMVHRDLKPENVSLQTNAAGVEVKLLDFGLSHTQGSVRLTQARYGPVGTAYYIAPEQFRGGALVTPAVDVYACGVMLYELLIGTPPVAGALSLSEAWLRLFDEGRVRPDECSMEMESLMGEQLRELERLFQAAVHRDPAHRLSLSQWLDALNKILFKLHKAYEQGPMQRRRRLYELMSQGSAKEIRHCLQSAVLAYPHDAFFQQRLAELDAPVPPVVARLLQQIEAAEEPIELLREQWESYRSTHYPMSDTLGYRQVEEELGLRERALEVLLERVHRTLMTKGPQTALEVLTFRPVCSSRWEGQKLFLERTEDQLHQLLNYTRLQIARGMPLAEVPAYWRRTFLGEGGLPLALQESPFLRSFLEDFLYKQSLFSQAEDSLLD